MPCANALSAEICTRSASGVNLYCRYRPIRCSVIRIDNSFYQIHKSTTKSVHHMDNKVVLITGSSSGIGEASALSFAKLGCNVIVHGTNEARVKHVAKRCCEISPDHHDPLTIVADLREPKQVEKIMHETMKAHGKLDVLINNAGLFTPVTVDAPNAYDIYTDMIKINLDSVVLLTTLAIPHLKRSRGCIVNVSSNLHSKCLHGAFAYSTAKAGLTMFTKSIAVDLAPHVRVNSVSPGPVATLMSTRCGMDTDKYRQTVGSSCLVDRVGEPEEIARVIVFLASPESSFITGSDYIIDGGSTIKPEGVIMSENN